MNDPAWIPPAAKGMSDWEVGFARNIIRQFAAHTYLEIGSRAGGSLWHFGTALPEGSRLVSVDIRKPKQKNQGIVHELVETCEHLRQAGYDVIEVCGDSHSLSTLDLVTAATGSKVDILLIDGDHSDLGVRQDVKDYLPLVRQGGLAILHDCGWRNQRYEWSKAGAKAILDTVNKVFREIAHKNRHCLAQELAGLGFIWM